MPMIRNVLRIVKDRRTGNGEAGFVFSLKENSNVNGVVDVFANGGRAKARKSAAGKG